MFGYKINVSSLFPTYSEPVPGKAHECGQVRGTSNVRTALTLLFVAGVYFIAAKLAFLGAYANKESMILWIPAGIALASLLICGYRVWPALFIGAVLSHPVLRESLFASLGVGAGTTLAAVFGAWSLRRFAAFDNRLNRVQDVLAFLAFPVATSSMISAIIGVSSLCIWHSKPWTLFGALLQDWWLGNAGGYLVAAPLLLVWISGPRSSLHGRFLVEFLILAASTLLVSAAIFGPFPLEEISGKFILFPFVIWGAYRFGQHGTTAATSVIAAMAVWWLSYGTGTRGLGAEDQLTFQIFMITLATTGLFLGSAISERNRAEAKLQQSIQELKRSNQELDDFSHIVSHDLKEPLRGVHNFSNFLLQDYSDKIDDEGKEMLNTLAKLARQMDGLLSALLDYSRLGKSKMAIVETDLNQLVENVVTMLSIKIRETGADVKIIKKLPSVICDHVRIQEVFQNLIVNALKYNDNNGIKIEIDYIDDHPEFPGEILFLVRDNGIGIDEKNLDSIFKIFHRLHSRDAYGGGTGAGLSITKKIIEQHGGMIWAESAGKGQGTTFYFTLGHVRT